MRAADYVRFYPLKEISVTHFGAIPENSASQEETGISSEANGALALAVLGVGQTNFVVAPGLPKEGTLSGIHKKLEDMNVRVISQESAEAARTLQTQAVSMVATPATDERIEARRIFAERSIPSVVALDPRGVTDPDAMKGMISNSLTNSYACTLRYEDTRALFGENWGTHRTADEIFARAKKSQSPSGLTFVSISMDGSESRNYYRASDDQVYFYRPLKPDTVADETKIVPVDGAAHAAGVAAGLAQTGITTQKNAEAPFLFLTREQVVRIVDTASQGVMKFSAAKSSGSLSGVSSVVSRESVGQPSAMAEPNALRAG